MRENNRIQSRARVTGGGILAGAFRGYFGAH